MLTQQDYLGLNHADNSGKVRGIGGIKFGVVRDAEKPVELFAEEIPRDTSGAEDPDDIMNMIKFTRDVARTHGISYKFVSAAVIWNSTMGLTIGKGISPWIQGPPGGPESFFRRLKCPMIITDPFCLPLSAYVTRV